MKHAGLGLLLLLAAVLPSAVAIAQEPAATVSIVPDGELTVGDPVEVRVRISHEPGDRVLMDGSVVQMGGMEPAAPVITELSETETLVVFQTRAFASGRFDAELPAIPIQRADQSLTELPLRPLSITISSVLDGQSEPRPISAPELLDGDRRSFAPWIVAIIGIGIGFVLATLVRRRFRRSRVTVAINGTEAAVTQPVGFESDATLDPAEQCRQLAISVRSRLAEDWSLPASALTPSEIGPALAAVGAPGVVVLRVTRLLEACDRVQFGGELPSPDRVSGYVQLAESIWSDGDSS